MKRCRCPEIIEGKHGTIYGGGMKAYLLKMKGSARSPPGVGFTEVLWSWLGSAIGIAAIGYLSSIYFEPRDSTLIIGSFGASAVLVYAAIKSPLAQPRNLIGGHVISGLVGVLCFQLFGMNLWIAAAFAVSFAIASMLLTKTTGTCQASIDVMTIYL